MGEAVIPEHVALVPGANDLLRWFGYWPTFHDAEVIRVDIRRSGTSAVSVHTFEATDVVNGRGAYVCTKHVVVTFVMNGIREATCTGFNHQNVLSGLEIAVSEGAYELKLEGCYGVDATITADALRIDLAPGAPSDSQYLAAATL